MWPWPIHHRVSAHCAADKRAERDRRLADAPPYTTQHDVFLSASASEIVRRIGAGEWTAAAVVDAYAARAAYAQRATNCLTEVCFASARREAQALDDEFAATKRLRGPLHGVPMSFKDQFDITGFDSSVGYTQWTNDPAKKDAEVVAHLRALGAIPLAKTNLPQTLMAFECANPLWGTTVNPHGSAFTPGGSSGGEGALLALGGSALGVGSDVGGSVRIPAAYCGVYSLKPGSGRISMTGARSPTPGFDGLRTVAGPMARCMEDLELACRALFGHGGGRDVAPVPFRAVEMPGRMRMGYYVDDGFVKASPACRRAVLEAVDALRSAGHECVEVEFPGKAEPIDLLLGLMSADGYNTLLEPLGGDPKESALFLTTLGPRLPGFLRRTLVWACTHLLGDKFFANILRHSCVKRVDEFYKWNVRRDAYARRFEEEVWEKYAIDGLVCPVQAMPVLMHGACAEVSPIANATIVYNCTDSPAGVVPVTRVDRARDGLTKEWTGGGYGSAVLEGRLYRRPCDAGMKGGKGGKATGEGVTVTGGKSGTCGKPWYDVEAMHGMPVGVQVAGRRWEEEKVLGMMRVLDEALGERGFGPGSFKVGRGKV